MGQSTTAARTSALSRFKSMSHGLRSTWANSLSSPKRVKAKHQLLHSSRAPSCLFQPAFKAKSRAVTTEEKSANVFRDMRIARADARMVGARQKLADERAEAAALK